MEMITREELERLFNLSNTNLISLYMPTHRMGRETMQDPIRFKNLLNQAENRLEGMGLRRP